MDNKLTICWEDCRIKEERDENDGKEVHVTEEVVGKNVMLLSRFSLHHHLASTRNARTLDAGGCVDSTVCR